MLTLFISHKLSISVYSAVESTLQMHCSIQSVLAVKAACTLVTQGTAIYPHMFRHVVQIFWTTL